MTHSGIIVIDGADCSGKTTLANKLVKEHGARYLHLALYKDLFMHQLAAYRLAERWASRGELVVIDRHWISEMAYGDSLRGGQTHPVSLRYFDRLLLRSAALYIMCVPSNEANHLKRFEEHRAKRFEMFKVDAITKVARYYRWLMHEEDEQSLGHPVNSYMKVFKEAGTRPDVLRADVEEYIKDPTLLDSFVEAALNLLAKMRQAQHPAGLDLNTPNLGGNAGFADFLLVGERANGKIRYPFYSRDDKLSSALWLNRALDALQISEHRLCFVNALDLSWEETSQELVALIDTSRYRFVKIVALGQTASRHLHRCGLEVEKDYTVIPHPQWARRFRYRDPMWYVEELGQALGIREAAR